MKSQSLAAAGLTLAAEGCWVATCSASKRAMGWIGAKEGNGEGALGVIDMLGGAPVGTTQDIYHTQRTPLHSPLWPRWHYNSDSQRQSNNHSVTPLQAVPW